MTSAIHRVLHKTSLQAEQLLLVEGGDAGALVHDLRVPDPEPGAGLPKHPGRGIQLSFYNR